MDGLTTGNGNGSFGSDGGGFQSSGFYSNSRTDNISFAFNKSGTLYGATVTAATAANAIFNKAVTMSAANITTPYLRGVAGSTEDVSTWVTGSQSNFLLGKYTPNSSSAVDMIGYIHEHISFASELSASDNMKLSTNQTNFFN